MKAVVIAFAVLLQQLPASVPTIRDLVGMQIDVRVTAVIDGDTVEALPSGEKRAVTMRLGGVDTPERGEAFRDEARVFTRVLAFDRRARVVGQDVDRYGRLVVQLFVGDKDVGLELVRAGLACHETNYSSDASLARAEAEARRAGLGFWALGVNRPRCAVLKEHLQRPLPITGVNRVAPPAAFRGNVESRVYHSPSCRNFKCRKCTMTFASQRAAQAAGFRPAKDCIRQLVP